MPIKALISALGGVPDPMLFINEDGVISHINAAAQALFGDWIGGRSYVMALRQPAMLNQIEAVLRGAPSAETRYLQTDQSGETVFRVVLTPLSRDTSGLEGVILHFTNITHLREAEEMRRDFVANVSHELRTPLTALMGFIETLRGPARNDPDVRDRFLGIMADEAQRMNRLVSDLLSLSQVESNERARPEEDVDLRGVLDGVVAALRGAAEDQHCTLNITGNAGPALIRGDRDQLTQVFMNLTENALKYGGEGCPVTLDIKKVIGKGSLRGPMVQVDVIDQGDGIDPLHLPRLTERFYRIDSHRNRAMGGTGLGLAIVKHIINRHRGRLRITSAEGQGSTFSVLLPKG